MNEGYSCEFCRRFFQTDKQYDTHLVRKHQEEE